jgi:hypothetical protein
MAITLAGSCTVGGTMGASPFTISHNNTGDTVLVVAVSTTGVASAATYNGVSMSLVQSFDSGGDHGCTIFVLTSAASGTHDVVITATGDCTGLVQSFSGVDSAVGKSGWWQDNDTGTRTNTVASAAGHMVVEGVLFFTSTAGEAVAGDNTLIALNGASGSTDMAMSNAAGTASVAMGWSATGVWSGVEAAVDLLPSGAGPTVDQYENAIQAALASGGIVGVNHLRT